VDIHVICCGGDGEEINAQNCLLFVLEQTYIVALGHRVKCEMLILDQYMWYADNA
jgi:hypothetical protein